MTSEDFLQDYVEEVKEHLQELESSLLILEREGTNTDETNQIFRAAHSIKGASAYMGYERLATLTHELESLISQIQTEARPVPPKGISILLQCVDFISNALQRLQESGEEPPLPPALLQDLRDVFASAEAPEQLAAELSSAESLLPGRLRERSGSASSAADVNTTGPMLEESALTESVAPPEAPEELQFTLEDLALDAELEVTAATLPQSPPELDGAAGADEGEIQEEDQELFNIFLTSFQEQFSELAEIIVNTAGTSLSERDFDRATALLKRLIASSQYMDYDQVMKILEEWQQALLVFQHTGVSDGRPVGEMFQDFGRRLQKHLPGLLVPSVPPAAETVPEAEALMEEEDEELFSIFLDSCQQQFSALVQITPPTPEDVLSEEAFESSREWIKRLVSSSQYMDYDHIAELFRQWDEELVEAFHKGPVTGQTYSELLAACAQALRQVLPRLQLPLAVHVPAAAKPTVAEPLEEDEELFSIFLDSSRQLFAELVRLSPPTPESELTEANLNLARELLARLISSSRYMDYDRLLNTLREWDDTLVEAHRSGTIDGALYAGLLDTYGQRLEQIVVGFVGPSSSIPSPKDASFAMVDQEIDASFDAFEQLAAPGDSAVEEVAVPALAPALERRPTAESEARKPQERGVQPSQEKPPKKARVSATPEETTAAATLRVDAQKVDQLLNQVGELVVTRSEFIQTAKSFRDLLRELASQGKLSKQELRRLRQFSFRLNESTLSLGRVANDLQDSVMRVRMLPISQLFQRFPRVVRDQAFKLGKKVELVVEGGETEIDKRVLEQMHDPIVQLLRNAIAHGIEPPGERKLAGKPETGTIRMAAYHEGDYVILEIEDDGRGVDTEKLRRILERRREMGLQELDRLSDQELLYAIFLPGISTHDRVDGSAGRGVGLDVVKENVERMNGTIEVDSYPQTGTRFTVRIPLTVAIIRALLVKGGDQVFTIPLSAVSEILRYQPEHTHTIEGFQVITLRGETIPLVHLRQLLNMPVKTSEHSNKFIVVVSTSFREVGLVVDGLMGEREVVIKSIEDDFHAFEGFSGATILGDGAVSLIVDVSALLRIRKDYLQAPAGAQEKVVH
jgi:two-component system, chemotaxis family, sensor kinase CheA